MRHTVIGVVVPNGPIGGRWSLYELFYKVTVLRKGMLRGHGRDGKPYTFLQFS